MAEQKKKIFTPDNNKPKKKPEPKQPPMEQPDGFTQANQEPEKETSEPEAQQPAPPDPQEIIRQKQKDIKKSLKGMKKNLEIKLSGKKDEVKISKPNKDTPVSEKKNESWSDKYKKSIDCNNPKGFSQKAHCAGRKKNEETVQEMVSRPHVFVGVKDTDSTSNLRPTVSYIPGKSKDFILIKPVDTNFFNENLKELVNSPYEFLEELGLHTNFGILIRDKGNEKKMVDAIAKKKSFITSGYHGDKVYAVDTNENRLRKTLESSKINEASDKAMMMKLTTKAMKTIANSPEQKEIIKQVNVYRKKLGMKPMKEEVELLENKLIKIQGMWSAEVSGDDECKLSYDKPNKDLEKKLAMNWLITGGFDTNTNPKKWAKNGFNFDGHPEFPDLPEYLDIDYLNNGVIIIEKITRYWKKAAEELEMLGIDPKKNINWNGKNPTKKADWKLSQKEDIQEKAVSKQQQKFFGLVRAIQKGEASGSPEAEKAARDMSKKDVEDFASTKHKGLPKKVQSESDLNKRIKELRNKPVKEDEDLKKVAKELAGASKMHMGQSKRISKFLKKSMKEDYEFDAETLLQQLGGRKFIAMTGAKDLMVDRENKSLHMKIGRNSKGINHLKITYMPDDTYTMDFGRIRKLDYKVVRSISGVYAEALQDVFTEVTGMYTSL